MNKLIFLILLIAGVVLIACGLQSSTSIASDFSGFLNGLPTDQTIWFVIAGMAAVAIGASGLIHERNA